MCLFCDIVAKKEPGYIVYENDLVCCFLDRYPINQGHVLVVPKRHYQEFSEVDAESLTEIIHAAQKIARSLEQVFDTNGMTILQNNGIFKDVDHYHMHVFPRFEGDGFSWIEPSTEVNKQDFESVCEKLKVHL